MCIVSIYYVYINTHTCMYIFQKNLFFCIKYIYNINYMNINIDMYMFSKYILYVCLYIYIINIHNTHIMNE